LNGRSNPGILSFTSLFWLTELKGKNSQKFSMLANFLENCFYDPEIAEKIK